MPWLIEKNIKTYVHKSRQQTNSCPKKRYTAIANGKTHLTAVKQ